VNRFLKFLKSRPLVSFLFAYLCAFFSLILLKLQIAEARGFDKSWNEGLALGLIFDGLVIALPFLLGIIVQRLKIRWLRNFWVPFLLLLYICSFASTLYYRFFGSALQWWVVINHFTDTAVVGDQALELALTPFFVASVCMILLSIVFIYLSSGKKLWTFPGKHPVLNVAVDLLLATALFGVIVGVQQWPRSHRLATQKILGSTHDVVYLRSPVLSQPLIDWLPSLSGRVAYVAGDVGAMSFKYLTPAEKKNPAAVLRAFREQKIDSVEKFLGQPYPLNDDFKIDSGLRKKWRRALGFADTEKVGTLFMFLESFRAYELTDPVQAPLMYPRLTKLFNEHGIFLTRGYTSAFTAGQTVRGMWQTFCSVFPDMMGPAPFLANAGITAECLPDFLASEGYRTSMFLATASTFHNKRAFEEQHGTQTIRDKFDYDLENKGSWTGWGVPDKRYFEKFLEFAEQESRKDPAFFVQGINTDTHPPFQNVKGAPEPAGWKEKTGLGWSYFHGSFHRLDDEAADFIEAFLKSPLADHSYLVISGDHSTPAAVPTEFRDGPRTTEIRFRIPVIFISKHLRTPRKITKPFHEVDVGLTIAAINGDPKNVRPWARLGRVLSPDENFAGSDWAFMSFSHELFYRKGDHSCYSLGKDQLLKCYLDRGNDPLFSNKLVEIPEIAEETLFFNKFVEADFLTVSTDRIAPKHDVKISR
jgi:hypothetical protein